MSGKRSPLGLQRKLGCHITPSRIALDREQEQTAALAAALPSVKACWASAFSIFDARIIS